MPKSSIATFTPSARNDWMTCAACSKLSSAADSEVVARHDPVIDQWRRAPRHFQVLRDGWVLRLEQPPRWRPRHAPIHQPVCDVQDARFQRANLAHLDRVTGIDAFDMQLPARQHAGCPRSARRTAHDDGLPGRRWLPALATQNQPMELVICSDLGHHPVAPRLRLHGLIGVRQREFRLTLAQLPPTCAQSPNAFSCSCTPLRRTLTHSMREP